MYPPDTLFTPEQSGVLWTVFGETRSPEAWPRMKQQLAAEIAKATPRDRPGVRAAAAYFAWWNGETDEAIERLAHAMRLSPLDSEMYRMQGGMALAHLYAGRFEAASSWAEKALRSLPTFLIAVSIIAASHALTGRTDEARQAMQHLRRLDPALRLSNLKDWLPYHRGVDLATFADGLRKAGLPE